MEKQFIKILIKTNLNFDIHDSKYFYLYKFLIYVDAIIIKIDLSSSYMLLNEKLFT